MDRIAPMDSAELPEGFNWVIKEGDGMYEDEKKRDTDYTSARMYCINDKDRAHPIVKVEHVLFNSWDTLRDIQNEIVGEGFRIPYVQYDEPDALVRDVHDMDLSCDMLDYFVLDLKLETTLLTIWELCDGIRKICRLPEPIQIEKNLPSFESGLHPCIRFEVGEHIDAHELARLLERNLGSFNTINVRTYKYDYTVYPQDFNSLIKALKRY